MPAAVVNHLHFKVPPDPELFERAASEVLPGASAIEGFRALHILQAGPDHYVLIILGDSAETLDRVAADVGSPWMAANVVPLLSRPPERYLGPLVTTTGG